MRQALGKGLDALIRQTKDKEFEKTNVKKIPLAKIIPNRYQPRKVFNDASLKELSDSIKKHGLAQPVILSYDINEDVYEIIAGERRVRASQLAGLEDINAIVHAKIDKEQMLALALVENIQREDLNAIDTALAFKQLISEFKIPQTELAKYCGKSKSAISNALRLLDLEQDIQGAVQKAVISEGHARALLMAPSKEDRKQLFHVCIEKALTVRQLEDLARSHNKTDDKRKTKKTRKPAEILAFEHELEQGLGTKVEINAKNKGSGTLVIHYNSLDELDKISKKLVY